MPASSVGAVPLDVAAWVAGGALWAAGAAEDVGGSLELAVAGELMVLCAGLGASLEDGGGWLACSWGRHERLSWAVFQSCVRVFRWSADQIAPVARAWSAKVAG
jgi:hypothetical protein